MGIDVHETSVEHKEKSVSSRVGLAVADIWGFAPLFLRIYMAYENQKDVADFISTLLHSGTVTHFMHLSTDSFAVHMALGAYYPEIIELTDSFAEAYSGCYEKIKNFPENFHNAKEPVKYMESIKDYVKKNRQAMPDETELQNIIDEIAGLIDSTLYKLTLK